MTLKLAPKLSLPDDAVTQTFGILAKRGAGKSNAAAVMAEEMYAAGLPFVVVDPIGAWWGLRSSSDGKGAGLSVPIFGGYRGDVPLEPGSGNLMAELIVDENLSAVLDVSAFDSEAAKRRFLADFATRLYWAKGKPGVSRHRQKGKGMKRRKGWHRGRAEARRWERIAALSPTANHDGAPQPLRHTGRGQRGDAA